MLYILLLLLVIAVFVIRNVFPIISGYGAKNICSNLFICDRLPDDVIKNELSSFPLNLGKYSINLQEQSVTGTVFGLARKKAVFRKGLGATLLPGADDIKLLQHIEIAESTLSLNQSLLNWPQGERLENSLNKDIDEEQLRTALEEAFPGFDSKRGTRAVVVVRRGEIVAERYAPGFSAASKLAGWSLAKSITSALIGILVKQGKLNVNNPAPVKEWENDERRNITIANLLQMSSGLRWWEYYKAPSDATNMLYR